MMHISALVNTRMMLLATAPKAQHATKSHLQTKAAAWLLLDWLDEQVCCLPVCYVVSMSYRLLRCADRARVD